jgi:hypothetical protein
VSAEELLERGSIAHAINDAELAGKTPRHRDECTKPGSGDAIGGRGASGECRRVDAEAALCLEPIPRPEGFNTGTTCHCSNGQVHEPLHLRQ